MDKSNRLQYFQSICEKLTPFSKNDIENGITAHMVERFGYGPANNLSKKLQARFISSKRAVVDIFYEAGFPPDIETLIDFLEYLVADEDKAEKGIVFTPKYIADFIVEEALSEIVAWDNHYRIIDPSCGCGIFLISAIEFIHRKFNISIPDLINNNIFGIDILETNASRCELVLELFCLFNGIPNVVIHCNLKHEDSLSQDWNLLFGVEGFDFIIGNPPYVNPHDMSKETARFLKENFKTTKSGVFNIFYAFIEHSLKYINVNGYIEFIVPNNFLTIKAATQLRELLQDGKHICGILDFSHTMIFKPVRTYSCIIKLSKENTSDDFAYKILEATNDIEGQLKNIKYERMHFSSLNPNSWMLADNKIHENIRAIEQFPIKLKSFIRTGIATLRDGIYIVSKDGNTFYKNIDGSIYEIEANIVKPIYKIPALKNCTDIIEAEQFIIFPYKKGQGGYALIQEDELSMNYPSAYQYLLAMKPYLDKRDNGKPNGLAWYAYGRSQGLNKYGRKLMFPTFSSKPNFIYVEDENALFCNGYAVFENEYLPLPILERILNSMVMDYYVRNTSYAIEGGYYCYQKKFVERFSLPHLNDDEIQLLIHGNEDEVNKMLVKKYQLVM